MPPMKISITHFGTATLLLEIGSLRLLTDPVFDAPGHLYHVLGLAGYRKRSASIAPDLPPLDAVLLSHDHHGDNLDTSGLAIARQASHILTTTAGARRLGGNAEGLLPWQERVLIGKDGFTLRVTATPAQHGPRWMNPITGPVIGFVLEWEGQSHGALYITGDTVLFPGVDKVGQRWRIGTLFPHAGRASFRGMGSLHYTLTATETAELTRRLSPHACYPIHYEGWSHFAEGKEDIHRACAAIGVDERMHWLPIGQKVEIET